MDNKLSNAGSSLKDDSRSDKQKNLPVLSYSKSTASHVNNISPINPILSQPNTVNIIICSLSEIPGILANFPTKTLCTLNTGVMNKINIPHT